MSDRTYCFQVELSEWKLILNRYLERNETMRIGLIGILMLTVVMSAHAESLQDRLYAAFEKDDLARFEALLQKSDHALEVDRSAGEVRIRARLQPAAFLGGWLSSTPRYHALVWKDGKAAGEALLQAYVSDVAVYDALVSLGAVPGNNLTMAAWNDRNDPNSPAPDQRIRGTPVDMSVWWEGLPQAVPLKDMLADPGGGGIDLRFGGNKALIPQWHSGCIVCLYSCPGSKVGNRAYTIRDYVRGATSFSVNWKLVPKGTRKAVVILRVHPEQK